MKRRINCAMTLLVAGAIGCSAMSALCEREPDAVEAYNGTEYTVQKSSFELFDIEGLVVDPLKMAVTEPGQQVGTGQSTGTVKNKVGPSLLTQIQTQAEQGVTQPAIFGGAKLVMLNSQSGNQISSFLIQTTQGKLIVVDGGFPGDADHLMEQIRARGGHVAAWLITHPQGDHAGALYSVMQNYGNTGITIDGIYYSMADLSWYEQNDSEEIGIISALHMTFQSLPQQMLHQVFRGQEILVDDVRIQVMNDRYDIPGTYAGNDASIVYKVFVNGKSILFLGDLAEEGGRRLLFDAGAEALKSDVVQMSHHGQQGVSEAFYQAVAPSVCLWPTPEWLWNNDAGTGAGSGSWRTSETKAWMTRLGVQIHYCMKDGDQEIH